MCSKSLPAVFCTEDTKKLNLSPGVARNGILAQQVSDASNHSKRIVASWCHVLLPAQLLSSCVSLCQPSAWALQLEGLWMLLVCRSMANNEQQLCFFLLLNSCRHNASQADIVLTFEDTWAAWQKQPSNSRRGRIAAAANGGISPAATTAAVVHGTVVLSVDEISQQLRRARRLGYRYMFLTDTALPNPWDRLPCYWGNLVAVTGRTVWQQDGNVRPQ